MVKLAGPFSQLGKAKILVAGDLLCDIYTIGKAKRISPEAPVAVLNVDFEDQRPGGAGNVILNLASLGAEVVPLGRIGNDFIGNYLKDFFINEKISIEGLFTENGYKTPIKNRMIADQQQIVRVDYETITTISEMLEQEIIEKLPTILKDIQILAISDYGKGFLTSSLLSELISQANQKGIPIITDPKGTDFQKYAGTTVLKPNLGEAYAAANLSLQAPIEKVAEKILKSTEVQVLMITRSEEGMSLFYKNGERQDFLVEVREVKDVTGAGDSVLAVMALSLANGLSLEDGAKLSNIAGGIAIEHLGCARIGLPELARRVLKQDKLNKIFDHEHIYVLTKALEGRQFCLLALKNQKEFNLNTFQIIRNFSQKKGWDLLIYLQEESPNIDFVNLLSSLEEVSFILIDSENLRSICSKVKPHEVFKVENEKLVKLDSYQKLIS